MRITDIKITNYRAFYGEHHFKLSNEGKNLMLYGENGSGKSSLFSALKDFFEASIRPLAVLEQNVFLPPSKDGTAKIEISLKENATSSQTIHFELNAQQREIVSSNKSLIVGASKVKGFFDYRSLLRTHLGHTNYVNLFNIIVKEVLFHAKSRFSTVEIGKEWEGISKSVSDDRKTKSKVEAIKASVHKFNQGVSEILRSIQTDTNAFLQYFGINVKITLEFEGVKYEEGNEIRGRNIQLKLDFFDKSIPKHQDFLNEAKLTALAISLYLASIKLNPTQGALKILVLDDLLIGLDMSNRLPLLDILKTHFIEVADAERFQIVMTTYDKVWYELVRSYFGEEKWKFVELYSKKLPDVDFEMPIIREDNGYLDKAKKYLGEKDFKASAVYIRTEFERLVKDICDKKRIWIQYKKNAKEVTSDDFWRGIETQTDLNATLIQDITIHRGVVMNPFSHYDLEKPEFERELEKTIEVIERLAIETKLIKKTKTFDSLEKEIEKLKTQLAEKEETIKLLSSKLKS